MSVADWIGVIAAFVGIYLGILLPATAYLFRREFELKGTASGLTTAVRGDVDAIVGKFELRRTLENDALENRFADWRTRTMALEDEYREQVKENTKILHSIDKRLDQIERRLSEVETEVREIRDDLREKA